MNACALRLRLPGFAVLIGLAAGVCAQQDEVEGFVPYYRNPEQTTELINTHIARIAEIIKAGNIKIEQ